ncbi:MAG: hypothetical protein ACLPQ6_14205 [Steroidobacteraceae bacterium]|jgi:hypothetical protein
MRQTEHILLESDDRDIPGLHTARRTHAHLRFQSALRRRTVELDIIDYYYLSVRIARGRAPVIGYVLDLRFVAPSVLRYRHLPWKWMTAALALGALSAAGLWWIGVSAMLWWRSEPLAVVAALLVSTAGATLVSAYRMTETFFLFSVHGRANLLEVTGGLGTFRSARSFTRKLEAHIGIAGAARRSSRGQHLRDEMREHFRLHEAGVLSNEAYDESKKRILAGHVN